MTNGFDVQLDELTRVATVLLPSIVDGDGVASGLGQSLADLDSVPAVTTRSRSRARCTRRAASWSAKLPR